MTFNRRTCISHGLRTSAALWAWTQVPAYAQNAAKGAKPAPTLTDLRGLQGRVTRLAVLTDRMIRAQAQRSLGVLVHRAERITADSVVEMRRLLSEVAEGLGALPTLAARHQPTFKDYAEFLEKVRNLDVKNRAALIQLSVVSDDLGEEVTKLAEDLEKEIGQPVARLLTTTAGLQRLTQDTAVHFLLGHTGPEARDQLEKVTFKRGQFGKLLAEVRSSPVKSAQTASLLPLLENQWLLMDKALDLQSRDSSAMENVCTTSERTLEVLTLLYPAYESLLKTSG